MRSWPPTGCSLVSRAAGEPLPTRHRVGLLRTPIEGSQGTQGRSPSVGSERAANPLEIASQYFHALNARDPDAMVSMFSEGGAYREQAGGVGLVGQQIADWA